MPVLEAIATAVPQHETPQRAVRDLAADKLKELAPDLLPYLDVFDTAGIERRYLSAPLDWFLETHGWGERNALYTRVGLDVAEDAARRALVDADLPPDAVDGVIFVSSTGIATPSLDARLVNRLGLRSDVMRVPVWGLGCAGGVAGLGLAADLARAHPSKRFLTVSLELCSTQFMLTDMSTRAFVAAVLFGDGAAAAVVRGDALAGATALGRVGARASHAWKDSEDVMGWTVEDEGLAVVFSRRIPSLVANDFAPVVHDFLKRENDGAPPSRYDFHPGGRKVIDAYESALSLGGDALATSRAVLREYGNMSSPTVLFVLKESLARRPLAAGERSLIAALGPGFAAELALVEGMD